METTKNARDTGAASEREDIPALSEAELGAASEAELARRITRAESSAVATSAALALLARVSFPEGNVPIPLAEELTPAQRAAAELSARRERLVLRPFALPSARVTRARWLGLEAPGVLEKLVPVDVEGEARSLPLWAARLAAKRPWRHGMLEGWVSRRELLDAYAELLLHGGYGGPNTLEHAEVWALLVEFGPELAGWAEALLAEAARLWAIDDPHATAERGTWTSPRANDLLATAMLYPLALAGRTLGPDAAAFVPFGSAVVGEHDLTRAVVLALRDDLREPTLLAAYELKPTLTAVQIATDLLRIVPLVGLAARAARDFHDPALKKSVPKVSFERLVARVDALCAEVPALASAFEKPKRKPSAKR